MKKILLIIFVLLFSYQTASAASIDFSKTPTTLHQGDVFELSVNLDPQDVSVNTLGGTIKTSGAISINKVNDGGSFVPLWIEKPLIDKGTVSFSGLIPGGFSGVLGPYWNGKKPGKILTVTFKATAIGAGYIVANLDTLLSNDGSATSIIVKPVALSFVVLPGPGQVLDINSDKDFPEPFTIQVASGWGDFASSKVALFSTYDQQSGMSHYLVKEGGRDFATETSPYILKDDANSSLIVRAYDNSGNYRESSWDAIANAISEPTFSGSNFWVIIVILIVCIVLLLKKFGRKSR